MSALGREAATWQGDMFRLLAENVRDYAIFVLDPQGRVRTWSGGAERIFGYTEDEIVGQPGDRFYTPDDIEAGVPERERQQALATGRAEDNRWHVRKDGSRFWSSGVLTPLPGESGQVRGFARIMRDRTEPKRAAEGREALHRQEQQFRVFAETVQEYAIFLLDPDGRITTWNAGAERIKGWKADEVIGHHYGLLYVPEEREAGRPERNLRLAAERGHHKEDGWRLRKDGSRFLAHVVITPVHDAEGRTVGFAKVTQDLTEAAQAEERLRASEGRLRTLIDNLPHGAVYQVVQNPETEQTRFTYLSAGVESMFGVTPDEAVADASLLYGSIHEEDVGRVLAAEAEALRTFGQFDCEFRHRHRSGEVRWAHCRSAPRPRTTGEVVWEGVMLDVTDRKRAEESLRGSEEELGHQRLLLRTITDNAPSMLLMMDRRGRGTFVNPAVERVTGFKAEELIGEVLHEKVHHSRPDGTPYPIEECPLDNALPLRESVQGHEDVFVRKDGTFFPVRCSARPVLVDGEPVATVIEVQDITEEKRASEALRERDERFRAITDHSVTGIAEVDLTGRYLSVNDRYCETLGRSRGELLGGMRMQDVTHPDDLAANLPLFGRLVREGRPFVIEKRYVRPDGSPVWVNNSVSGVRGPDGRIKSVVAVSVDVTDRKGAEEELREANRRKDEFLAMLAHELRNPLAPIRTGLDLLAIGGTEGQVVEAMQQQVTHLVRLVDDLLDVSRIMRGRVELRKEPVDLASVVKRAVDTIRPQIDARRQSLAVTLPSVPVRLQADPVRLAQAVSNLLHNASKYNDEGGGITISARAEGDEAVVSVSDTGVGIEPDLLPRLFDLFTQAARSIDRSQGGLGIGLTVVKSLVEMHDGSVAVRSEGVGRGSEFTVRLPMMEPAEAEPGEGAAADAPVRSCRILVVDDNAPAAKLLGRLLGKLGDHVILAAHDGPSALAAAEEFRPDLILLDIGLPRMDGYEVARRLREWPEFRKTLLVALTGYGTEEDRRRSIEAGFDDHLTKPPGVDLLRKVLAHPKLKKEG